MSVLEVVSIIIGYSIGAVIGTWLYQTLFSKENEENEENAGGRITLSLSKAENEKDMCYLTAKHEDGREIREKIHIKDLINDDFNNIRMIKKMREEGLQ